MRFWSCHGVAFKGWSYASPPRAYIKAATLQVLVDICWCVCLHMSPEDACPCAFACHMLLWGQWQHVGSQRCFLPAITWRWWEKSNKECPFGFSLMTQLQSCIRDFHKVRGPVRCYHQVKKKKNIFYPNKCVLFVDIADMSRWESEEEWKQRERDKGGKTNMTITCTWQILVGMVCYHRNSIYSNQRLLIKKTQLVDSAVLQHLAA